MESIRHLVAVLIVTAVAAVAVEALLEQQVYRQA